MDQDIKNTADRQIITTSIFHRPAKIIFSAWTNPELLTKWWGPKGFTNTFHEFDPRPGGNWKLTMHGPDKGNYYNESVFIEISEPERIVLEHLSKPRFKLTAVFEEITPGQTKLIFTQVFDTVEDCNKVRVYAVDANEENMDRLENVLQELKNQFQNQ